jgi:hypothetical protein
MDVCDLGSKKSTSSILDKTIHVIRVAVSLNRFLVFGGDV